MNSREEDDALHGLWSEVVEPSKTVGSTPGLATVQMDPHTMSILISGLNDRIANYEREEQKKGTLDPDDKEKMGLIMELRDKVVSTRDKTLAG